MLAVLLGLVAVVDQREKTLRSDRAELAEWYCSRQGTRCGGPSSAAIERSWNRRELGYELGVGLLGVLGAAGVVASTRRR